MKILHINSYYATSKFYKELFDEEIKKGIELKVYIPVENNFKNNDFNYGKYSLLSRSYSKWERSIFHLKHYRILADIKKDMLYLNLIYAMHIHGFLMVILHIN